MHPASQLAVCGDDERLENTDGRRLIIAFHKGLIDEL